MIRKPQSIHRFFNLAVAFLILAASTGATLAQSQEDVTKGQSLFNSGNSLLASGDFAGAIRKFTEAMSLLPTWHLPYLNRGVAQLSMSKLSEAEADADKALSLIRPGATSATQHAAIAYQVKGTVKQNLGDYKAALEYFSLAVERVPTDAKFRNSKGTAYRLLDRNEEALAEYTKAIELEPRIAIFYVNRAQISERLNDNIAALKDLDTALGLDKKYGPAYYSRGALRMRAKSFPDALTDLNEAIRLNPEKSAYYHARGLLYTSTRQFDLAVNDHTQAIALDPKNSNAFGDRAIAYDRLGNTKAAIEDLKTALSLNVESSALRYNLSYLLYKSGRFSEAAEAATQTVSRSPNWREPYLLRSNAYVKLGMTAQAKADRDRAASLGSGGKPNGEKYLIFDLEVFVPEEIKP
jgi:tetratricopeptide (TPR) repeat protein